MLRRPAIVARVAMNGGIRSPLIMRACTRPIVSPMSRVRPIASATIGTDGGGPLLPPVRSHSVKSLALTTDESATTAPVDRSIPPAMITTAAPTASTPKSATRCSNGRMLYVPKKGAIAIQEVDDRQDEEDPRDQPPLRGLEECARAAWGSMRGWDSLSVIMMDDR